MKKIKKRPTKYLSKCLLFIFGVDASFLLRTGAHAADSVGGVTTSRVNSTSTQFWDGFAYVEKVPTTSQQSNRDLSTAGATTIPRSLYQSSSFRHQTKFGKRKLPGSVTAAFNAEKVLSESPRQDATFKYRNATSSFLPDVQLSPRQKIVESRHPEQVVNKSNHLVLTAAQIHDCLVNNGRWHFSATSGSVVLKNMSVSVHHLQGYSKFPVLLKCMVHVRVPAHRLLSIRVFDVTCHADNYSFIINEHLPSGNTVNMCFWSDEFCRMRKTNPTIFTSVNSTVEFTFSLIILHLSKRLIPYNVNVSFKTLTEYEETLQVAMTSPLNGYVSTPKQEGIISSFVGINMWAVVTIPEGHDVMVSLPFIDCLLTMSHCLRDAFLGLYERLKSKHLRVFCRKTQSPSVHSLRSGLLYVRFVSQSKSTGFKLLFSLSPRSTILVQRNDGMWNCSVPQWPDFRHHFPCNLHAQCFGWEDEAPCSYTTPLCGVGRFTVAGSCYVYIPAQPDVQTLKQQPDQSISWKMAEKGCQEEGGHLASFNSYREMLNVTDLLYIITDDPSVYVGMVPTGSILPALYMYMWKTLDESINHYTGCLSLQYRCPQRDYNGAVFQNKKIFALNRDCLSIRTNVLCEVPPDSRTNKITTTHGAQIPLLPFTDLEQHEFLWNDNSYLKCSSGHVTHSFLACDIRSACWARNFPASASCSAPMTPLPPEMTCGNGVQYVPYTLVCDHHSDCDDDTDEDFCVFSPCDVLTQFQCLDGKCVPFEKRCDKLVDCRDASDEYKCWIFNGIGPDPHHSVCHTPVFPPAILLFDGSGESKLRPLNQQLSLNGKLVKGSLTNGTLRNATLIGYTLVKGSHVNETVISGILVQGTLVSGILVTQLGSETLVNETLVSGMLVSGLLAQGTSQQTTLVNGTLLNSTLVSGTSQCPETHFQCLGDDYCVPVFTRCNNMYDCSGREDEAGCDNYQCPGFYRCRGSTVCVHRNNLCDGVPQCPQNDDELLCDLACPNGCICYGLAFFCSRAIPVHLYPRLRYLDASDSGLRVQNLQNNTMLVCLSLVRCDVDTWDPVTLPNLRTLDLGANNVTKITSQFFHHLPNLRDLALAHNPLSSVFLPDSATLRSILILQSLDLSGVVFSEFDVTMLSVFPRLNTLNMTGCHLDRVIGNGFHILQQLRVLDLRGCPMTFFPRDVFHGLDELRAVYADNYRLCCPAVLPGEFYNLNCKAPSDEVSSCEALLRSIFFRICLCLFAVLACAGNISSMLFRMMVNKNKRKTGFDIFVLNLCISDFLMGVYLSIIGVADRLYMGTYLWYDVSWRHSTFCKVAGFLSLLSSEVSAFIICLITLDRFLALRFPFSQLRFSTATALSASALVWAVCFIIAAVPLMPMTLHWNFYGQTGICIPLPITRTDFKGHSYSFNVMIVFNFVLFVITALGQLLVFLSVHKHRMPTIGDTESVFSKDQTLARRLITVAVSDFLCWFPIGLVGMMAANGYHVPTEVNLAMAIFVLPLNSAINPFLYTLNIMLEKIRISRERRLRQYLLSERNAQDMSTCRPNIARIGSNCSQQEVQRLLKLWFAKGMLSREYLSNFLAENGVETPPASVKGI